MGFFDDLGKGLNKVGKKTSDMASVAKLKLDITKNKSAIDKKYEELGSRIYFLSKEGVDRDESVDTLMTEIDQLFANIAEVEAEIEKINAEKDVPVVTNVSGNSFPCGNCGAILPEGTKFCGSCGSKIEVPVAEAVVEAVAAEEGKKCPNCGAVVGDAKFCNSCGTSIE